MWRILVSFLFIWHNVSAKNLRKDPDLWTFNTEMNSNITAKIQDEAVIISLTKLKNSEHLSSEEHILFGFDIFNFVPQNFRVSVNHATKKLYMNLTSTIDSYSIPINLGHNHQIKSIFFRLGDEDDTVFVILNCNKTESIVTPINLIKFFRSLSVNKFKILFNKNFELKVFTEEDNMEEKLQEGCRLQQILPDALVQFDIMLDRLAQALIQYTPQLIKIMDKPDGESKIATELFIKSFLTKSVNHRTSNLYRLVHLIQSLEKLYPDIFHPELQTLLLKIFWTKGAYHNFVRKGESNYYDNTDIKTNLIRILFSNAPKTFMDKLRTFTEIGDRFRTVFANDKKSINKLMLDEEELKRILLRIVFKNKLDDDQKKLLNPNHFIATLFADYYLIDLAGKPKVLNNIYKRLIFNTDKADYIAIGKFIRYVYLKPSAQQEAKYYLESDMVIGMRIVYVLSSGQVKEKRDIYSTVKNLITKKDVELPKSMEYPEAVITDTLNKIHLNPFLSRGLFMHVLENLFIYDDPHIGQLLDYKQGAFIYEFYRDLILNDIKKQHSVIKGALLDESLQIHEMIASIFQAMVENIDDDKELRPLAKNFVVDALSYAKLNGSDIVKTEDDYVLLFKKIVGKANNVSQRQKIINFVILLRDTKLNENMTADLAVSKALSHARLKVTKEMRQELYTLFHHFHDNHEQLYLHIDRLFKLGQISAAKELKQIIENDFIRGVTFHNVSESEFRPIFKWTPDEEEHIFLERYAKMKELKVLEDWYRGGASIRKDLMKNGR
ncbi:hypothetical protein WA026_002226 [Henosepilachna vigintioctopunctata]|uniref:Uncharacterized protein n=1 Tax=Henosepilachna vigintioctopunctata TaxID=420089 RepID=A0AAW1U1Q8_9CUCU